MNQRALRLTLGLGILFACATANAFPFEFSWHTPAHGDPPTYPRTGASSIYGTGGQGDWGITCANCHIKSAGTVKTVVAPAAGWDKKNGVDAYLPGKVYTVKVTMTPSIVKAKQLNGFAATVEDANGKLAGVLMSDTTPQVSSASCPPKFVKTNVTNGTSYLVGDCRVVFNREIQDITSWTFFWKAPAQGAGPLTLYFGSVNGDTGGDSSLDDAVKVGTVKLVEGP
jgi:hypothetical protein